MADLINFVTLLNGKFDNKDQFEKISKTNPQYPYAKHINTICNSKIANLPNGFEGVFMIEESYYSVQGTTRSSSHLFLFMEESNSIKLISYEIPEGYDKKNFTYKMFKGADYDQLKCSAKFTPAFFRKSGDTWEGGSVSMFSPVLKFSLHEKFTENQLEVSESMEVNGKRTFGYDEPIIYKRIKQNIDRGCSAKKIDLLRRAEFLKKEEYV